MSETKEKERTQVDDLPEEPKSKGALTVDQGAAQVREQFEQKMDQISVHLPSDVSWDRFINTIQYAVSKNPELIAADRRSLITAGIEAAQDGLLPDGREGAFTIYNVKTSKRGEQDTWKKSVKWMPMIRGLTRKILETGQVKEFRTRVVYEADEFEVIYGDEERIVHKPNLTKERGEIVATYAVLVKTNGGVEREVMTRDDLDRVRAVSKAQFGPWGDWFDEMGRKSVGRRLVKRVPLTPLIDQILSRDEAHFDLDQSSGRVAIDAPAAPTREQFREPPAIEGHVEPEVEGMSAREVMESLEKSLDDATEADMHALIYKLAMQDGTIQTLRKEFPKEMSKLIENFNAKREGFSRGGKTEGDAQESPAESVESESASEPTEDEMVAAAAFCAAVCGTIDELKKAQPISEYMAKKFPGLAKKNKLSPAQIKRVEQHALDRIAELKDGE